MAPRIEMNAKDRADLASWFQALRDYYGIPSGQPVFPPRPRVTSRSAETPRYGSRRNGADHPWRKS
jgi:hypothetical protein